MVVRRDDRDSVLDRVQAMQRPEGLVPVFVGEPTGVAGLLPDEVDLVVVPGSVAA